VVALGLIRGFFSLENNELGLRGSSPPGARGSSFIVPPSEYGPMDQTDID